MLNRSGEITYGVKRIMPCELKINDKVLGRGGSAIAKEGEWISQRVAVKIMPLCEDDLKEIERELNVLSVARHCNIIQTYGYCQDK